MDIMTADLTILLSLWAFLAIFLLCAGLFYYFTQRAKKAEVVKKIQEGGENRTALRSETSSSKNENIIKKWVLDLLGSLGTRAASGKATDLPEDYRQMRLRFLQAGLWRTNTPAIFWGTKILLAIGLPACFFILRVTVFEIYNDVVSVGLGILIALLAFYMPDIWLTIRTNRRKDRILKGMPDALDLLVVCVEAGMGLDAAINRVADEIKLGNKTLSEELKFLTLELRAGKSRQDALRNLALRTDLEDVNSFVTLLIQTDKFGTSVAQALRVYSDTFRTKRYQKAEEIAAKLAVKLVFPCILFIFPSLFVAILGPAAITISRNFLHL